MGDFPTPISILETFFERTLTPQDMAFWKEVSDDTWVDFAKTYLAEMKAGFTPQAMADRLQERKIRLYFDLRMAEQFDREIARRYSKTPLLGHSPYPSADIHYRDNELSQALAPLKKHLLVADELYLPDNFYRCFDAVADSYQRSTWRTDPNIDDAVHRSVAAIRQWLPILAGLRDLITSKAISFLPYYVIPSFPYSSGNPFMTRQMARLNIPPDPSITPAGKSSIDLSRWKTAPKVPDISSEPRLDCNGAIYAWLNARLLGLDPVFADKKTWHWASGIAFREESTAQLTTDLMSIDILPLGDKKGLSISDIVSMRQGEQVFAHIRDTLIGCKDYVSDNVVEGASGEFVTKTCREYIREHLDPPGKFKLIRFLDNDLAAGTALSIAVSALFMTANPWLGLLVPAALTPKAVLAVEGKFSSKVQAKVCLEALL